MTIMLAMPSSTAPLQEHAVELRPLNVLWACCSKLVEGLAVPVDVNSNRLSLVKVLVYAATMTNRRISSAAGPGSVTLSRVPGLTVLTSELTLEGRVDQNNTSTVWDLCILAGLGRVRYLHLDRSVKGDTLDPNVGSL